VVLRDLIRDDAVVSELMKKTALTFTQLDTYIIRSWCRQKGTGLNEQRKLRDGGEVTSGSFLRTLRQSRENISRAICTVILLEYLELLPEGIFLALSEIVKKMKEQDTGNRISAVRALEEILNRLV